MGFNNIITIDGTIYKKTSITGGNYRGLCRYTFNYDIGNSNIRPKELDLLNKSIEQLQEKVKKEEKLKNEEIMNENDLKEKISILENEYKEIKNNILNYESKIQKTEEFYDKKNSDIKQNQTDIQEIQRKISENEEEIQKIEENVNIEKKQIFKKFMKENNLKDLNEFEKISLEKIIQLRKEIQLKEEKLSKINSLIKAYASKEEEIKKLNDIVSNLVSKLKNIKKDHEKWVNKKLSEGQNINLNSIKEVNRKSGMVWFILSKIIMFCLKEFKVDNKSADDIMLRLREGLYKHGE